MGASQSGVFNVQELTDAGVTLVAGRLYTYAAGTTTLKLAYTDPAATIPHTYTADGLGGQYIALNARGELPAPLYLLAGAYDLTLKRADGSTVWTRRAEPTADGTLALLADLADPTAADKGGGIVFFSSAISYPRGSLGDKVKRIVDIRDAPWNAPKNGIDDDGPALQACINYFKPYGLYNGAGVEVRIGKGVTRLDSGSVDMTDCHGMVLRGEGRGASQLKGSSNNPLIIANNTAASPLSYAEVRDMTLYGPGAGMLNADGIRWTANNSCTIDVRVWACRSAISLATSFQTVIESLRIDGQGGLSCYDGLVMPDGELAVAENALEIQGGQIYGCQRYGIRGECITGSKFFGLEVLGCGDIGVYFGDSPGGKDLKWFTWSGGLIDTCKDLLIVARGSSPVAELMHWSGLWMGYATDAAVGVGADFRGCNFITFRPDLMVNMGTMLKLFSCFASSFEIGSVKDYDRTLVGANCIEVVDSSDNTFRLGAMRKTATSPAPNTITEAGTSAANTYFGGNADGLVYLIPGNRSRVIGGIMKLGASIINMPEMVGEFLVSNMPVASLFWRGKLIAVLDEVGGYTLAFCDGTNWRRVQDRAIVS